MTFSPAHLILLLLLAFAALCEDWFMPGSRLISDVEFKEALTSTSTYKMVKFFTPNCVYCRYLKNVFDTLKAERHWSF
jgi:thiol-disulfide isomerase/thioredoxin